MGAPFVQDTVLEERSKPRKIPETPPIYFKRFQGVPVILLHAVSCP